MPHFRGLQVRLNPAFRGFPQRPNFFCSVAALDIATMSFEVVFVTAAVEVIETLLRRRGSQLPTPEDATDGIVMLRICDAASDVLFTTLPNGYAFHYNL